MQLLFTIPVLLTLLIFGSILDFPGDPAGGRLAGVAVASMTALLVPLLAPVRADSRAILLDAAAITGVLLIVLLLLPGFEVEPGGLARLLVASLLMTIVSLCLLGHFGNFAEQARPFAVALIAALLAAPVWLAPAVESAGNPPGLTTFALAASPVTVFASAIDLDFLRTNWFYEHSALGSLRYAYPAWTTSIAALGMTAFLLVMTRTRVKTP